MAKNIVITRDIEGKEEVEKLVSLNPDRYEWKDFYKMLDEYADYCRCYERADAQMVKKHQDHPGLYPNLRMSDFKTFQEWLTTEI